MIEFHLPNGAAKPPAQLKDSLRLNQDLGLDSLALTEMAFKLDDLFGIPIETREVMGVETVRDLKSFLRRKLDPS
jgi:acyl carrier protein